MIDASCDCMKDSTEYAMSDIAVDVMADSMIESDVFYRNTLEEIKEKVLDRNLPKVSQGHSGQTIQTN